MYLIILTTFLLNIISQNIFFFAFLFSFTSTSFPLRIFREPYVPVYNCGMKCECIERLHLPHRAPGAFRESNSEYGATRRERRGKREKRGMVAHCTPQQGAGCLISEQIKCRDNHIRHGHAIRGIIN